MPAQFSRLKNWVSFETLYASDLNAEFNNILTNLGSDKISGWSTNLTQLRIQSDPSNTTTDQASNLISSEIERLRFQIAAITGNQYWYQAPSKTLLSIGGYRLGFYLPFDGDSVADIFRECIRKGVLLNAVNYTTYDVGELGSFQTTTSKFGQYSYALSLNKLMAIRNAKSRVNTGYLSCHMSTIGTLGGIACNPNLGLDVTLTSGGFLQTVITTADSTVEGTKDTKTVTGNVSVAASFPFKNVQIGYSAKADSATDTLFQRIDGLTTGAGTDITGQSIRMNTSDGGAWFIGCKLNNPAWDFKYTANGLPTAAASAWTATGTAGQGTVSNGVLTTVAATGVGGVNYAKNSYTVSFNNFTAEFKARITPNTKHRISNVTGKSPFSVYVRDASKQRSFRLDFTLTGVTLSEKNPVTQVVTYVPINVTDWHVYRIGVAGGANPVLALWVDGVCLTACALGAVDNTANSLFQFGFDAGDTTSLGTVDWEYVAGYNSAFSPPVVGNVGGGYLSDFVMAEDVVTDTSTQLALSSSKALGVFGSDRRDGIGSCPMQDMQRFVNPKETLTLGQIMAGVQTALFHSDGTTPVTITCQFRMISVTAAVVGFLLQPDGGQNNKTNEGDSTLAGNGDESSGLTTAQCQNLGNPTYGAVTLAAAENKTQSITLRSVFPYGVRNIALMLCSDQTDTLAGFVNFSISYG